VASKGYSSEERVALVLGRELEPMETAALLFVLEAAERVVDARTGRAWLTGISITAETHALRGAWTIRLKAAPVTSVSAVRVGYRFGTWPEKTLTVTTEYTVDLARGLVHLAEWWGAGYDYVEVDYVPVQAVPADIAHATTLLAAHWLALGVRGESGAIESFTVDGLSVRYRDAASAAGVPAVPDAVEHILAGHAGPVFA
jgi:hypothetical protein